MALELKSAAFPPGGDIPKQHTCDGVDSSPPLEWTAVPADTRALALLCEDPDAPSGLWVHWVVWGIAPTTGALPEGVKPGATLAGGALDVVPELEPGATRQQLLDVMQGHILGQAELMGRYGRS